MRMGEGMCRLNVKLSIQGTRHPLLSKVAFVAVCNARAHVVHRIESG